MKALPSLWKTETGAPDKLEKEICLLHSGRKRSGTLPVFTYEQIIVVISLACQNPCDLGYEVSQINPPLLTAEIKKQGVKKHSSFINNSTILQLIYLNGHMQIYY